MKSPPLVSVVIVNHNYGRYLGECIDSVLAQSYSNIEVIAVDDGSTDESLAILKTYAKCISVVRQENKGVSAARNAGIRRSNGDWIAFLDSDDTWHPEKLQAQSRYFQDRSAGLIACGMEQTDEDGVSFGDICSELPEDILPLLTTFTSPPLAVGSAGVASAECLREVGGFDEMLSISADLDLLVRVSAQHRICSVDAPLLRYRRHAGSMSSKACLFERDGRRVLAKLFSNPACARVHHLRGQSFGRFHMAVAGSYYQAGDWTRAVSHACKALCYRPSCATHLLGLPIRSLQRFRRTYKAQIQYP
jgi:glycosyltransferase involved in cell wall biosynthesis